MRHSTLRALSLTSGVMLLLAAGDAAHAGSVLLSRESTIRATGSEGGNDFALSDGSDDFSDFANAIDTAESGMPGPRVAANQNSRPSLQHDGAFVGAYAEGSASVAGQPMDYAEAASAFDLTFEVFGSPTKVTCGGAVGLTGIGSTAVTLINQGTGDVVLVQELMGGEEGVGAGRAIEHTAVLVPGVYELLITANASGLPEDESMAYYTMSLSLAPADAASNVTPVPLPPAAWSAAGTLAAAALARGWHRVRSRKRRDGH